MTATAAHVTAALHMYSSLVTEQVGSVGNACDLYLESDRPIRISDEKPASLAGFSWFSRYSGFISNVPLFKCSSVTLISIDNLSVTDAILCNWHFCNDGNIPGG
jgi:hypothetical protein